MSHEILLKQIQEALIKDAKLKKIKIKIIGIDQVVEGIYHNKRTEHFIDLILLLENRKRGVLFVFEVKTGSKEAKARKQLQAHKSLLLSSRNELAWVEDFDFDTVEIYWISEEQNRIVNMESQHEVAFNPTFLEDPFLFLCAESL